MTISEGTGKRDIGIGKIGGLLRDGKRDRCDIGKTGSGWQRFLSRCGWATRRWGKSFHPLYRDFAGGRFVRLDARFRIVYICLRFHRT